MTTPSDFDGAQPFFLDHPPVNNGKEESTSAHGSTTSIPITLKRRCEQSIAEDEMHITRSKADFLSTISHELRSPLHGILASVELMRETSLDPAQADLVSMIQNCSGTLLDTLNHVLDYSKINDFRHSRGGTGGQPGPGSDDTKYQNVFGKQEPEYLCKVVQDVVEGVHFGHSAQKDAWTRDRAKPIHPFKGREEPVDPAMFMDDADSVDEISRSRSAAAAPIGIFIDMESRAEWFIMLSMGAWKRIVMNLFANSLKYTSAGHIEVKLKLLNNIDLATGRNQRIAHLMVRDTGIGMSEDFIRHQLYQPFSQENPLAMGTGLGLNLVKRIVTDLGGSITVDSGLGIGTRFDVHIPISDPITSTVDRPNVCDGGEVLDPERVLRGRKICLLSGYKGQYTNAESAAQLDQARKCTATLQKVVDSLAQDWFEMEVIISSTLEDVDADFVMVEGGIHQVYAEVWHGHSSHHWIMLGSEEDGSSVLGNKDKDVTWLNYPIGPKSLAKALFAALGTRKTSMPQAASRSDLAGRSTSAPEGPSKAAGLRAGVTAATRLPQTSLHNSSKPEHVLLVDDNAINLRILSTYTNRLGVSAATAENGRQAVDLFTTSSTPFTTVFMDLSMPVLNGFEASRAIREYERRHPDRPPTRIIALTGLGTKASRQEATRCGIDDYRIKPVKLGVLKEMLQS